jgi:hypothetical protein
MADIFPVFDEVEDAEFVDANLDEDFIDDELELPDPYGFTWKFDFTKGDIFTDDYGNMATVSDHDCLREWIAHTLSVEKFETPIYGGDIGTSINEIVGAYSTMDAQAMRLVEDDIKSAIGVHDRIESVERIAAIPLEYDMFVYMRYVTDDAVSIQDVTVV